MLFETTTTLLVDAIDPKKNIQFLYSISYILEFLCHFFCHLAAAAAAAAATASLGSFQAQGCSCRSEWALGWHKS